MSEQTPNTPEGLGGGEPSMEDILASIRKIISDDEPVAMESPEDTPVADLVSAPKPDALDDLMQDMHFDAQDLTSDAVLDAAVIQTGTPEADVMDAAAESVDLNIDDVLADLEADIPDVDDLSLSEDAQDDALTALLDDIDTEALESEAVGFESVDETRDMIESDGIVPDTEDDILAFLDADIPMADEGALEFMPDMSDTTSAPDSVSAVSDDDFEDADALEMDALLDDILLSPADGGANDAIGGASFETEGAAATVTTAEDSDLELVKSLMADLADNPDELETDEDLDALLSIPDAEDEPVVADFMEASAPEPDAIAAEPEAEDAEEDILGDILDMTLEDEFQSHPDELESDTLAHDLTSLDDVTYAEQENIAANADAEDVGAEEFEADDLPSLSEIAAAAEADAIAVETVQASAPAAAPAGLAATLGGAALGAAALGANAKSETAAPVETQAEAEIATPEIHSEPLQTPNTTQETTMPVKAVNTDAILDEVTETATAGAFAQLTNVVEDKAVFNERGPRIGDLVQDALRPMLKEWLDSNLKGIVERAVTKEVKRISSGK